MDRSDGRKIDRKGKNFPIGNKSLIVSRSFAEFPDLQKEQKIGVEEALGEKQIVIVEQFQHISLGQIGSKKVERKEIRTQGERRHFQFLFFPTFFTLYFISGFAIFLRMTLLRADKIFSLGFSTL